MNCIKQYLKESEISLRHNYWDGIGQNQYTRKKDYCPALKAEDENSLTSSLGTIFKRNGY